MAKAPSPARPACAILNRVERGRRVAPTSHPHAPHTRSSTVWSAGDRQRRARGTRASAPDGADARGERVVGAAGPPPGHERRGATLEERVAARLEVNVGVEDLRLEHDRRRRHRVLEAGLDAHPEDAAGERAVGRPADVRDPALQVVLVRFEHDVRVGVLRERLELRP